MGLYTKAEVAKKPKAELLELAEKHSLDYDEDATVADLRALLLEVEDDEEEIDDTEEEAEEADDEEEEDDLELPEEEDEVEEVVVVKKTTKAKKTTYTKEGQDSDGNKLLGAKEVATQIGTDAKTLRQFFRSGKSTFEAVGAGGRYEFSEADIPKIKAEFETWKNNKPGRGRAAGEGTTPRKRGKAAPKPEEVIEEVEEIEELEDLEELDEEDLELED